MCGISGGLIRRLLERGLIRRHISVFPLEVMDVQINTRQDHARHAHRWGPPSTPDNGVMVNVAPELPPPVSEPKVIITAHSNTSTVSKAESKVTPSETAPPVSEETLEDTLQVRDGTSPEPRKEPDVDSWNQEDKPQGFSSRGGFGSPRSPPVEHSPEPERKQHQSKFFQGRSKKPPVFPKYNPPRAHPQPPPRNRPPPESFPPRCFQNAPREAELAITKNLLAIYKCKVRWLEEENRALWDSLNAAIPQQH